jgi:hypothetical protein
MTDTEGSRIQIYVDGETRLLFLGMRVRHAIGSKQVKRVECDKAVVVDGDGHRVDLDGALYDGERLEVVRTASHSDRDELDDGCTECH